MRYEIKPNVSEKEPSGPEDVTVLFRLRYSDWRRFENSRLWHQLAELVGRLQYKPYDEEEYQVNHPMDGRVVSTIGMGGVPHSALISFSLSYRDWCELRDSPLWHRAEEAVRSMQKQYSR